MLLRRRHFAAVQEQDQAAGDRLSAAAVGPSAGWTSTQRRWPSRHRHAPPHRRRIQPGPGSYPISDLISHHRSMESAADFAPPANPVGRFTPVPFGPAKISPPPEGHLHEMLAPDSPIITAELFRISGLIYHYPDNPNFQRTPKYLITKFVDAIEEGLQYLDLFDFLREEYHHTQHISDEDTFCNVLMGEIKNMDKFNKLRDRSIRHAVNVRISEMKAEHKSHMYCDYLMFLSTCDYINMHLSADFAHYESHLKSMFPGLESSRLKHGFQWYRIRYFVAYISGREFYYEQEIKNIREEELQWCHERKEEDIYVSGCRPYNLAFKICEKGYIMDQNPEVELCQNVVYDYWFQFHFMKDAPMEILIYEARTVAVSNVSPNASAEDIKQSFSFVEIEHIQMEMESMQMSQIAYVVFKNLQGTESALTMQGLTVLDLPVIIKPCLGFQQRRALCAYLMSEAASFRSSEEEKTKFDQALEKYRWLRSAYAESRKKLLEVLAVDEQVV